jgi:hypothetical protein
VISHYSYLVCPLGVYRKFYQFDVPKEWADGRIRVFHHQCKGVIVLSRDAKWDHLACKRCGSRLSFDPGGVFGAIRKIAIDRCGTQAVNDQIQFSYLDPGELPAEW